VPKNQEEIGVLRSLYKVAQDFNVGFVEIHKLFKCNKFNFSVGLLERANQHWVGANIIKLIN
jgi:hypothetical protein